MSIANWILASRPKTLVAAVAPVLIGSALAFDDGRFHIWSALAALLAAVLIQMGTNFANDYFDFRKGADTSQRRGPVRAVQSGLILASAMKRATVYAFAAAFLIGIYLVYRGGWPIVIIGLCSILFGVLYTGGPKPIGYLGLGELFVLIFFGPVAVWGTYYVQGQVSSMLAVVAGLSTGLFSTAILVVNNLRDIETDTIARKNTLAVRFGAGFAKMEYLVLVLLAHQPTLILAVTQPSHFGAVIAQVTFPLSLLLARTLFITGESARLNQALVVTGQLLLAHAILFSVGWLL